jgi:hypothetical protein
MGDRAPDVIKITPRRSWRVSLVAGMASAVVITVALELHAKEFSARLLVLLGSAYPPILFLVILSVLLRPEALSIRQFSGSIEVPREKVSRLPVAARGTSHRW